MKIHNRAVPTGTAKLPFAFRVLWSSVLLDGLGKFVITFLGLYLVKDRLFSIEQATLIISAYGIASIPSAAFGGIISDKIGHRNTVIFGFLASALSLLLLGAVRPYGLILIMAMFLGFVHRLNKPAITALVAEIVPEDLRKRAYHLNYWAGNLGVVFAMPIAGILAGINYQLLFIGDALTAFGAGIALWLLNETRQATTGDDKKPALEKDHPALLHNDYILWGIAGGTFLFAAIYAQIDLSLPLDMQAKGISETGFGTILALNPLVIVLFQVPLSRYLQPFAQSKLLSGGSLLLGAGFALHSLATTPFAFVIPVIIWTTGEMMFFPNALALITEIAPHSLRARYQGVFYTAWGSLRFVGASLGGILLERQGAIILWPTCLIIALIAAIIFLTLHPAIQKRIAQTT